MYDLLIEDATIVSGSGRSVADIGVIAGQIAYVGSRPAGGAKTKISAIGRFVIPGLIDTHVHFRDPGHPAKEDWESGSRAAVSGGVTTVCDMPNTTPPTLARPDWYEKQMHAAARSRANFGIWVGASADNVDEARALADDGPACGIKVFMGASTGPLLVDDATLEQFFLRTQAVLGVHAEDEALLQHHRVQWAGRTPPTHHAARPAEVATAAVAKLIALTRATPRRVHICHVSTMAEMDLLNKIRGELPITTEVSPHHLFLSTAHELGNFGKVNPPLRPETDRRALWASFMRSRIDTVGSDHAPHTRAEKAKAYEEAPSGMPGVETILPLLLAQVRSGRIPLERLVAACCEAPARIFGFTNKGAVREGADADLVIVKDRDLVRLTEEHLLTRVGWSPFTGQRVSPKPDAVYVLGELVASAGEIVNDQVRGRLVRPSHAHTH